MKKIYSNPMMEVIKIETRKMLAESTTSVVFGTEQTADKAQGREFSFFDED